MKRSSALCVLLVFALVLAPVIAGKQQLDIEDGHEQGKLKNATAGQEEVRTTEIGGLTLDPVGGSGAAGPPISNLAIPCTGQVFDNMADYLDAMAAAYEQMAQHYSTISSNLNVAQDGFVQQCMVCQKAIQQVQRLGLGECDPRLGGEGLTAAQIAGEGIGPALCHMVAESKCEVKGLKECRPDDEREMEEESGDGAGDTTDGEQQTSSDSPGSSGELHLPLKGTSASQWKTYGPAGRHRGIDIHVPAGTPTYAIADGILVYSERGHTKWTSPPDTPNSILLKFDKPIKNKGKTYYFAWYTHMKSLALHVPDGSGGRHVTKGTNLGTVGLGNKVPHLHFGILIARPQGPGQYMDPLEIRDLFFKGGADGGGADDDGSGEDQGTYGCQGGDMGKLGSSSLGACAPYMGTVEKYMSKHGLNGRIDPLQVAALMMQESSCNPSVNCGGIMQVDHPCRVDKGSSLYCACKGNADLGIDLGLKELAANLNKAQSLGASSSDALTFVQFGYNRGMGAMGTAISYSKSGASTYDAMMRSCEKYYGAGTKWNDANYYCRKKGHGPRYPEIIQERFEEACRQIGGTPASGGPAIHATSGPVYKITKAKSVDEAVTCPLCAAVPCSYGSECRTGNPKEGGTLETKDVCGDVLRAEKEEETGAYECIFKPGEQGDCCIRKDATCPSKCKGDCDTANATLRTISARATITTPSVLVACQRAMADLHDACSAGGSDVIGERVLDPCSLAERTGRDMAALDQRTQMISALASQLRVLARDVRSSMRTGAPPPELEQHVNDLVGMLESGGRSSVTEFQYELTALVTLTGDPLIRDVDSPGTPRNSDAIGYTDVSIGPISINIPASSTRRYDVDDGTTGQDDAREDTGIVVARELKSARVGYRGSGPWDRFCGRYNVKNRTTVAKERESGGSTTSSGGNKGVPELRQQSRRVTSDAPVAGYGQAPGRCESELVDGAELRDVNVDAWSLGHVAALQNLARLDPDKLFM
ncbi:MAG: M23 family metallopeptidase, partial [Methanopyri archaeon]|nr:M23 family metallopeptidase [Methanopyri archaeon]